MNVHVERFVTGPIETNTYLVADDSGDCIIIDPSSGLDEIIRFISEEQITPRAIVATHGHFDHIGGIPELIAVYPALPVYIHPGERELLRDPVQNMSVILGINFSYTGEIRDLEEGPFSIGALSGTVFLIPGHSPAGCALLIGNFLLCGDILFAGSIGRTDFPGGSQVRLIAGIREKLLPLDDAVVVCPGHMGRTTIGRERRMNPYL